jgi:hypothetical protein
MARQPDDKPPEPKGGRAARHRREFPEERFPGGDPDHLLPDSASEEQEGEPEEEEQGERNKPEDAGASTEGPPPGDYPDERLREFIYERFPGGLPPSSLPFDTSPEKRRGQDEPKEDAADESDDAARDDKKK